MIDYKQLRAAVDAKLSIDPEFRTIMKRITEGRATFIDTARYSQVLSHILGSEVSKAILNVDDREAVVSHLLHDSYEDINDVFGRVQKDVDKSKGLDLKPQRGEYPGERVEQFVHSLVDPTVEDSVIKRRARAGTETITKSFHDDAIKVNAEFHEEAGLKCYIERIGVDCCQWCSDVAGKYEMKDQPQGIFRRHDNCDCTVIYDGQVLRGQVGNNGRRSKKWVEVPKDAGAAEPVRLNKEQTQKLEQEKLVQTHVAENTVSKAESTENTQIKKALADFETENYKNSTEKGLLILQDGTTVDFGGTDHHVTGNESDIKLMNGAIFTHNHPTDNTFSANDILTGIVKGNLKELRAVTSTGDIHILINNGAIETERRKFYAEYQQRRMKAENIANSKIRKGENLDKNEYVKKRLEDFMIEHAKEYNMKYTKTNIDIHNSSLDKVDNSGIIKRKARETAEKDVHKIGNIDIDIFKCVSEDIITDEVIITDERIKHIKDNHPNDFELYCKYMKEIVESPDYIIEANKPKSALILKSFENGSVPFKTVLRLVTSTDNPKLKNSIITFMKIDDKEWKRLVKNKKVLYKSE